MSSTTLLAMLRGPFHFLRPTPEEVRRLIPDLHRTLPLPQRIFLEQEDATPIHGFPVLRSEGMQRLHRALGDYIAQEEEAQLAIQERRPHDRKAYASAWERYRQLLGRAVENVTVSSYGRHYPAVFWLAHSRDLALLLKETPKRILRRDSRIGRQQGDHIKYRLFERYLDRVLNATYDLVNSLAIDTEEAEEELFPRLLTRMRDNVLLLTEDHVSSDLAELSSYFTGHLGIDGRDLRRRLEALERWLGQRWAGDAELRHLATHLLGLDAETGPRELLKREGGVAYLATRRDYDPAKLLNPQQIRIWDSLLVKLKEFEFFQALRRLLVPVELREGRMVSEQGGARRTLVLSEATRPMDFFAPWVVDPLVYRFGMIYDITGFSETVSVLRRSGSDAQERSFRQMFRFQRRVNRIAASHRTQLEKYLGDGAFYSSRRAVPQLAAAVLIQRLYRQELDQGFPFDRGLRIALNYGQYRIIPIGRGDGEAERYEFFGHSLIELSRLTTGKASREIDEIKTLLIRFGYPPETVYRFFSPLMSTDVDVVERSEESRLFYAYINRNGTLFNEGIVATEPFVSKLAQESPWRDLSEGRSGDRSYVVVRLEEGEDVLPVGLRKLGMATLKGLERVPVYEVVDGADLKPGRAITARGLLATLEETFAQNLHLRAREPVPVPPVRAKGDLR